MKRHQPAPSLRPERRRQAKLPPRWQIAAFGKTLSPPRLTNWTGQLAELLDADIPLLSALDILADNEAKARAGELTMTIRHHVATGMPLSKAMQCFPREFDRAFVQLVELGEASGKLSAMLARIAQTREQRALYHAQIQQALIYPAFVCALAIAVVFALLLWAVPAFEQLFGSFDAALPPLTVGVLRFSRAVAAYGPFLGLMSLPIFAALWLAARRSLGFRLMVAAQSLHIPLIGPLLGRMAVARWATGLSILLAAGMPLVEALKMQGKGTGHPLFDQASQILAQQLARGASLASAMDALPYFPSSLVRMVRIAEQGGSLDAMLDNVGKRTANEVKMHLATVMRIVEPLVICACGGFVAILVLSLYLPIIELGNVV